MTFNQTQYEALISKIKEGSDRAFSVLRIAINDLENIPATSSNPALKEAGKDLKEAVQVVNAILEWSTLPLAMLELSKKWENIGIRLHNTSTNLSGMIQSSNDFYDGRAAKKHVKSVTLQQTAVSDIHGKAMSMSTNCNNLADSIFAFYGSVAGAVGSLLLACLSPFTGPLAPATISAAIGGFLIAVGNAFKELVLAIPSEQSAFTAVGMSPDGWGYGRWPVSTK